MFCTAKTSGRYPSDADHRFVYNTAGERIEAVDERGTSRSEFHARGRLLRLQDADGGVIEYRHDAVGNLLERPLRVNLQPNSSPRLLSITIAGRFEEV